MSSDSAAALGTVLVGRYRLDASLGTGGMAEVFRAADLLTGRFVALKVLRGQHANNREAVARLRREGEVLSALRHPSIVGLEGVYEIEGTVFLVMELLEGETLGARIKRGPLTPMELAPIVAGVAAGLAAAHAQHVVHRDLKPDNIFLVPDRASGREGAIRVKLLDFGISKVWYGERLTHTGQVLGTPRYMSPEQLGAESDLDARVDVYSLGVILYEALSGRPPFLATTPTDLIIAILHGKLAPLRSARPDLSPSIEAVVMRAMSRTRDARFRTAPELADAFLEAAGVGEGHRLMPQKGLATRAMGSIRAEDSGVLGVQLPPPEEPTGSASRVGTFSELPAFQTAEDAQRAAATLLQPMVFDDLPAAAPVIPRTSASFPPPEPPVARPAPTVALDAAALPQPGAMPMAGASMAGASSPGASMAGASMAGASMAGASISMAGTPSGPLASPTPSYPGYAVATPSTPTPAPRGVGFWIALVVAGLAAGGVTAGLVIAVVQYGGLLATTPTSVPTSEPASDAQLAAPDAAAEAPLAEGVEVPPGPTAEPSVAPERAPDEASRGEPDDATNEGDSSHGHHDTARRDETPSAASGTSSGTSSSASGASGSNTAVAGTNTTTPTDDTDPLARATRALRAGNPSECVDILDDLIAQGATPAALRRRGDCLLRLGDRAEAIRDYQRFCRLVPDHPAIGEVREVLEGLGQTCP